MSEKWGLLEKRKDYKVRTRNHREKKAKIKILQEKAKDRNHNEFSFGMMSSKVDSQGRKIADRGNKALSTDMIKLLKMQDAGYIRTYRRWSGKREELEHKMVLADKDVRVLRDGEDSRKARHTVYVGNAEEQKDPDADDWFGTGGEWPDRAWNRPRKAKDFVKQVDEDEDEDIQPKKLSKKQQEAEYLAENEERAFMKRQRVQQRTAAHLEAVKARERDLMAAEKELEKQRAKMNNTIGGTNKHGVKFKIRSGSDERGVV